MTALLEIPAIRRQVFAVPVEVYHRLTEGMRTELLRGTIIEKMSKSPAHQFFIERVREILSTQIAPDLTIRQKGPLTLVDSEPEPDVSVVRGSPENYRHTHPTTAEMAVEIAVTSPEIDHAKALIYAEASVKEYWIVCPEEKRVEVFRQPGAQSYAETLVVSATAVLASTALPGVRVELAALFA